MPSALRRRGHGAACGVSWTAALALGFSALTLYMLASCGTRVLTRPFFFSPAASPGDVQSQRLQFLLVAKHRHMLQLPPRTLHDRGLREHAATTPVDMLRGIQASAAVTWGKIEKLPPDEWSVLWSFQQPRLHSLPPLAAHHRVNHFPNNAIFVSKPQLTQLHTKLTRARNEDDILPPMKPFMPNHFLLPADMDAFENAWRTSPGMQWVAKKKSHRGVHMVKSLRHAKGSWLIKGTT